MITVGRTVAYTMKYTEQKEMAIHSNLNIINRDTRLSVNGNIYNRTTA